MQIKRLFSIPVFLVFMFLFVSVLYAEELPAQHGFVNDGAGMIEEVEVLERSLVEFEESHEVEFVVLTIEDLGEKSLEDYSNEVFELWGLDQGILMVVSVDDVYIRVCDVFTDVLTDEVLGDIQSSVTGYLEEGDYSLGIMVGVDAVQQVFLHDNDAELDEVVVGDDEEIEPLAGLLAVGVVVAILLIFMPNFKVSAVVGLVMMFAFGWLMLGTPVLGLLSGLGGAILGVLMGLLGRILPFTRLGASSS